MNVNHRAQALDDVLSSRQALLAAATLNGRFLDCIANADNMEAQGEEVAAADLRADGRLYAQGALSLATYALALDRWSP